MAHDWVRVASLDDMREGQGFDSGIEVAGEFVGIFLIEGKLYAVGECTHERGPISQGHRDGVNVTCPWHSARFDVTTGECLRGPVACRTSGSVVDDQMEEIEKVESLFVFEVRVDGNDILVRPRT